jgi:hypothetical protein
VGRSLEGKRDIQKISKSKTKEKGNDVDKKA